MLLIAIAIAGLVYGRAATEENIVRYVHISWGDVWPGAILTALLFTAAQVALSVMDRLANPGLAFGAAGALVVILMWFDLASPTEPSQPQPVEVKDSVISAKHLTKKLS